MKTFIILLTALVITSCTEDEVIPSADPFVGSWLLVNPDMNLEVSFDVNQDGDHLFFENVNIEYPGVTATDYDVQLFDRYAVNAGYEEIIISGEGITINMIRCGVHLKTSNKLDVYTMEIQMADQEPIVLQDQVFTKAN